MILDTTLLIDLLRGDEKARARVRKLEEEGALLWVPAPAVFELWEGVERADRPQEERRRVADVLEGYTELAFEPRHAEQAGSLSGRLVRHAEMIDPVDAQIAGTALQERRPVLTRNVAHFARVAGLKVETY